MTLKMTQDDGTEIEVYTAAEMQEREATVKTQVEKEYKPKIDELSGKLTEAERAAAQRAVEFGQFRKLSEDQVKALSEKDAIIYNNTLQLNEAHERENESKKKTLENAVDTAIRSKTGTDEKLFEKTKAMYGMMGIEANTPEEIGRKVLASLGALSQTEPDLIATLGFSGGSFEPPKSKGDGEKSFADSERGIAGAAELGLKIPEIKK